jgi:hypothetical protein
MCLPFPSSVSLRASASVTAAYNCQSAPSSTLDPCDSSIPLTSSHPPIFIPDRQAAADAASAATTRNLQRLHQARLASPWGNFSSIACSGLDHQYPSNRAIEGTRNSPNWRQDDYQDTRRKTCVFSRACVIAGRVTVFLPPAMRGKTANAYNWLSFEEGMVHAYSWEARWTRGSWDEVRSASMISFCSLWCNGCNSGLALQ